jgi:hypothetical protein
MSLSCKRKLEYSSDLLEEIVINPNIHGGHHEYPSKPIQCLIKLTKLLNYLVSKHLKSRWTENERSV